MESTKTRFESMSTAELAKLITIYRTTDSLEWLFNMYNIPRDPSQTYAKDLIEWLKEEIKD